jgi:hypothetical protein
MKNHASTPCVNQYPIAQLLDNDVLLNQLIANIGTDEILIQILTGKTGKLNLERDQNLAERLIRNYREGGHG